MLCKLWIKPLVNTRIYLGTHKYYEGKNWVQETMKKLGRNAVYYSKIKKIFSNDDRTNITTKPCVYDSLVVRPRVLTALKEAKSTSKFIEVTHIEVLIKKN